MVEGLRPVALPRDEGLHPEARHEWWYFAADVHSPSGNHYHYTTCLMRNGIGWLSYARWWNLSEGQSRVWVSPHLPPPSSPSALPLVIEPRRERWSVVIRPGRFTHRLMQLCDLHFVDWGQGAALLTRPEDGGIRRYGADREMGWYAWPNLSVGGFVGGLRTEAARVEGRGWMEHQWGNTNFLQLRWRYVPVLLESGQRLVAFRYEYENDPTSVTSEVAWIKNGALVPIEGATLEPAVPGGMTSRITSAVDDLDLTVHSVSGAQIEIPFVASFYEGPSTVIGTVGGQAVKGTAMTEFHPMEDAS